MIEFRRFLSFEDVMKNMVLKLVPNLKESEIEAKIESGIVCTKCGQKGNPGTGVLLYRMVKNGNWIKVSEFSECKSCRDIEVLKNYMQESLMKQDQEKIERLIKEYFLLPEGLKNAGFKNYEETNMVTTRAKAVAAKYTKEFLTESKNMYNLLIMGNPGTGKSHLCSSIARTIKEKGFSVGLLTTGQFLSKIKATFNKNSTISEDQIFQDIRNLDLLILDDVGSEATTINEDWRKSIIFEVVECRSGKPTIYTSNLTGSNLSVAIGARVFSRLHNNTKFVDLFTDDYREKLQLFN